MASFLNRVWERCRHRKRLDSQNLLHTEWTPRLGPFSLTAIALSLTLTLNYYIILPKLLERSSLKKHSVPSPASPLFAYILAFFIIYLAAYQLAWISRRIPKNCTLYNFAYTTQSQFVGFGIAWSQFLDAIIVIVIMAYAFSDHFKILFNEFENIELHKNLMIVTINSTAKNNLFNSLKTSISKAKPSSFTFISTLSLVSIPPFFVSSTTTTTTTTTTMTMTTTTKEVTVQSLDWFCIILILLTSVILLFSLRILCTITVIFLIAALFTLTSTTIVALLHNIANLRINYVANSWPENFDGVLANLQWFLIAYLSIECITYLAEESEEPKKAVSSAIKFCAKFNVGIMLLAFLSFFPFVYRMKTFHLNQPIPIVFNSLGIHSARYLMNVGALCGLLTALLCSFLPATRLLSALGGDSLLPCRSSFQYLSTKSTSPRFSVFVVTLITVGVVFIVPRNFLIEFLPLNLCVRLFTMAIIVYKRIFANNDHYNDLFDNQKYNSMQRLRNKYYSIDNLSLNEKNNYDSDHSDSNEDFDNYVNGNENDLLEQIWRSSNNSSTAYTTQNKQISQIQQFFGSTAARRQQTTCIRVTLIPQIHNCLRSPCSSNYHISDIDNKIVRQSFHMYDTSNISMYTNKFKPTALLIKPKALADADSVEKTAQQYLIVFVTLTTLFALSSSILWQTTKFIPILGLITCVIGFLALLIIMFRIYGLRPDVEDELNFKSTITSVTGGAYGSYSTYICNENQRVNAGDESGLSCRLRGIGCLTSIFLLIQLFFQFSAQNYFNWTVYMLIGLAIYLTRVCVYCIKKQN